MSFKQKQQFPPLLKRLQPPKSIPTFQDLHIGYTHYIEISEQSVNHN